MGFPQTRLRRLRQNAAIRTLVQEHNVQAQDLIMPLFIVPGQGKKQEISSMPGQFQRSQDETVRYVRELFELGLRAVLLFAVPEKKDECGDIACAPDGIIQETIRQLKNEVPDMYVITDLCFCEYTTHGHCGVMREGELQNDETLPLLVKQAVSHAQAGADMIAPSGMLDGAIFALRQGLDEANFSTLPIMSYAAKFSSNFYGPFRDAVESSPEYGDRKSYQMNPANIDEALREVALDIEEGADIVMVKPGLAYLDVLSKIKSTYRLPTAAYHVSGEYAMLKAAAMQGWLDEEKVLAETLLAFKRAGADLIITYFAEQYARALTV